MVLSDLTDLQRIHGGCEAHLHLAGKDKSQMVFTCGVWLKKESQNVLEAGN